MVSELFFPELTGVRGGNRPKILFLEILLTISSCHPETFAYLWSQKYLYWTRKQSEIFLHFLIYSILSLLVSTSYTDLVNVPSFGKKRENNFNPERGDMGFFCRDCWKVVEAIHLEPQKIGKQVREYLYECPICHGKRIALGTIEGLKEHYDRKK